jgi:hypothetical protein
MGRRVIVTPASSPVAAARLLSLLEPQRAAFAEWHLWLCTADGGAAAALERLAADRADWVKLVRHEHGATEAYGFQNADEYVRGDTTYLRLHERVAWLCPGFCEAMLRAAETRKDVFACHANAVGNPALSYLHARRGLVPGAPALPAEDLEGGDDVATDPGFARRLHEAFVADLAAGRAGAWACGDADLRYHHIVPLDAAAWQGASLGRARARMGMDDALFVCRSGPQPLGMCCAVVGAAVCLRVPDAAPDAWADDVVAPAPAVPATPPAADPGPATPAADPDPGPATPAADPAGPGPDPGPATPAADPADPAAAPPPAAPRKRRAAPRRTTPQELGV